MQFFKRILKEPEPEPGPETKTEPEISRPERRSTQRFKISPDFPLKAVLSFIGRDDTGTPLSNSPHGWNWKGRLIDCSEQGARLQLGPGVRAVPGENCNLHLSVEDFELTMPCRILNLREHPEGMICGLKHEFDDEAVRSAYRQLLEVVALGATLKLQSKAARPDASGYLVEKYASDRPSCLTVWRHPANARVSAFEFLLKDNMVRAATGLEVMYLSDTGASGSRPATPAKSLEIHRLFQWVVPNLPRTVPADVQAFLRRFAT